jgi:gamma-glutamylcyclotransferase (GGCT)/AIG2-like uncharacterized protein YtfP
VGRLYAAYGSNLNREQMRFHCRTAKITGVSILEDYELLFRGGLTTVEPKPGGRVPVLLWEIGARDERSLDAYEGFPRLYRKEDVEVELDGKPASAMLYIIRDGHRLGLPTPGYFQTIAEGYDEAGFDRAVLEDSVRETAVRLEQKPPEMERSGKLYIAYGSNLNLRQMRHRCPTAKVVGKAELADYELLFRSVATVEPKPGGRVPVLVWEIGARDERALDAYEGFPRLYRKEDMSVEMGGKPVSAMIYLMNGGRRLIPPSKRYYDTILEGYQSAGFDRGVLDGAVHESSIRFEETPEPQIQQDFWNMKRW